jgi:hypothetical protein
VQLPGLGLCVADIPEWLPPLMPANMLNDHKSGEDAAEKVLMSG